MMMTWKPEVSAYQRLTRLPWFSNSAYAIVVLLDSLTEWLNVETSTVNPQGIHPDVAPRGCSRQTSKKLSIRIL